MAQANCEGHLKAIPGTFSLGSRMAQDEPQGLFRAIAGCAIQNTNLHTPLGRDEENADGVSLGCRTPFLNPRRKGGVLLAPRSRVDAPECILGRPLGGQPH